ncbi:MAG: YfhO family protein [Lachnospiraceae bacterium]|nr:YfhO family protein [Lachnospiraceae bacterium]
MKKKDWIVLGSSFLLPVLCMIYILYSGGFYPFGDKSMLIMDMKTQYVEFFASLRNALSRDDSLFFSWSRSMGGNYIGIFTYYIASPLSFITLFFPVEKLPIAIEVLTVLKIGLCGLTFYIYVGYQAKKADAELSYWILLPVVCYALMSYNMVYSLSLMWLDGVILLPLIIMGTEKILDGKKGLQYLIFLTFSFVSNYYTGYMIGIFTALFVLYRFIALMTKNNWKILLKRVFVFGFNSVLAVGLSAPFVFGAFQDLLQGKLSGNDVSYRPDATTNFEFAKLFGKYTNGNYDSITNGGLPAIYCGYIILLLAVLFFFLHYIKLREKIGAAFFLVLFAVSFCYIPLDMAWHGFQYPNWFPYRYAFLFGFVLNYTAVRTMCEAGKWRFLVKPSVRAVACGLVILIAAMEMCGNGKKLLAGLDGEFSYGTMTEYTDFMKKTKPLVDDIRKEDTGFYRINQGYEYSKNDAMLLGYHGMTHYSSTFNASVNSLTRSLGISQGYFWNSGYFATPLLNDLFSVKYVIADRTVERTYQKRKDTDADTASYENENALSIMYGANGMEDAVSLQDDSPFINQNQLVSAITGEQKEYFMDVPYTVTEDEIGWTYSVTTVTDNPLYLYMQAYNVYWADVYVNDSFVGNYFSNETNGVLFLGDYPANTNLTITVVPQGAEDLSLQETQIAQMNTAMVTETMNQLQKNRLQVTKHKGGRLEGTIALAANQRVMTSIPYDDGWTIRVDGKKTEQKKFADTFMTFDCDAGEHTISISYVSPGFLPGVMTALAALLVAILYYLGDIMPWSRTQASHKK